MKKNNDATNDVEVDLIKVEKTLKKSTTNTIFESIKNKLIEVGVEYVKANMEQSKSAIFGFIERNIENRIRKEVKRYQMLTLGLIILIIGILFILYSGFEFISYLAGFPSFLTNLVFGFFLLLVGSIIYLMNK